MLYYLPSLPSLFQFFFFLLYGWENGKVYVIGQGMGSKMDEFSKVRPTKNGHNIINRFYLTALSGYRVGTGPPIQSISLASAILFRPGGPILCCSITERQLKTTLKWTLYLLFTVIYHPQIKRKKDGHVGAKLCTQNCLRIIYFFNLSKVTH